MFSLIQIAHAAADTPGVSEAQRLVGKINDAILFPLIALMMAIAFVVFLYGAFEYVKNATNEAARETGRSHLIYGVIGMLVMLSAGAILQVAAGTFGLQNELENAKREAVTVGGLSSGRDTINRQPGEGGGGAVVPNSVDIQGKCYSVYDCGPSLKADPFEAMRDELIYTGGLALGGMTRMDLVRSGEAGLALDQVDYYYKNDAITLETRDRLIAAINADTDRPRYVEPLNDSFVGSITNVIDGIDVGNSSAVIPVDSEVVYSPFEREMIDNGVSTDAAVNVSMLIGSSNQDELLVRAELQKLVDAGIITPGTLEQVLIDKYGM